MAKNELYRQLNITLPTGRYPVFIGRGLQTNTGVLNQVIFSNTVFIVTDETVATLYLKALQQALLAYHVDTLVLPAGEAFKNNESLCEIHDALINAKHDRDTTLIAVGGGVIGDLVGFAASTYQRGVRYIQMPTTLLAQVDASIGGKTAINHASAKNMIGSFYQPHAVMIDVDTLKTLPLREFRSGLAEIIKYALLVGEDFLAFLTKILEGSLSVDSAVLPELIAKCCLIKARFFEGDVRETGARVLLNLGHTVAHALEACTHYEKWLHGEAVAIGLYCAALLSQQLGHLSKEDVLQVDALLVNAGLPRRIPRSIDLHQLMVVMMSDKKVHHKQLRFVLMKAIGNCYLETHVTETCLHQILLKAVEGDLI